MCSLEGANIRLAGPLCESAEPRHRSHRQKRAKDPALEAGKRIRALRELLGLTVRDVEAASALIAEKRNNRGFLLPLSRLFEIENKDVVPSAYRFYSLAVIYRRDIRELLGWYGIDVEKAVDDIDLVSVPSSHLADVTSFARAARVPVADEPCFRSRSHDKSGAGNRGMGCGPSDLFASIREP